MSCWPSHAIRDIQFIRNFMLVLGSVSSVFDFLTFGLLLWVFHATEALFQTGWFIDSLATQVLVIFVIRTRRNPLRSRPNPLLAATSLAVVTAGIVLPYSAIGRWFGFVALPPAFLAALGAIVVCYDASPDEIRLWEQIYRYDTNTGVITRNVPLFDIDLLLQECAEAIEEMVRAECEERGELLTRIGKAPKRGLVFRTDEPFPVMRVIFVSPDGKKQRLEFLSNGQQFVAYGVHQETHQPYRWFGRELTEVPRIELPYIREADARLLLSPRAPFARRMRLVPV